MKQILLSAFTVFTLVAVVAGGTQAVFTDAETVTGNTFAAGSLDLALGALTSLPFNVSGIVPGDSGNGKVTLTSSGDVDADLDVAFANFVQNENGCIDPEIAAGDPCDAGDLGLVFQLAVFLDVNKDGTYNQADGDIELEYSGNTNTTPGLQFANANNFVGDSWDDVLEMHDGDSVDLVIQWNFPHNAYAKADAIFMTDTLGFDVETSLEQVGGDGGVAI